jgi:probable HAF family extracellular repeat protein
MMKHRAYISVFRAHFSALALSFVALTTWAQQPTLTWSGVPSGYQGSFFLDISADGRTAVGYLLVGGSCGDDVRPIVWTRDRGFAILRSDGFAGGFARAISADGLTIVGNRNNNCSPYYGAAWTFNGLTALSGAAGEVYLDVSPNGSAVVGWTINFGGGARAFRWTPGGSALNLGTLAGGNRSEAYGVSADGSIVVGYSLDSSGKPRAFRWTQQDGMGNLGTAVRNETGGSESFDQSEALGISPDGNVIVGIAYNSRNEAVGFRNILQGTRRLNISLGDPPKGFIGVYPRRTNQNGSIIVGAMRQQRDGTFRAMRWTQGGRLEDLNVTYASLVGEGAYLAEALDITPDGRYIVGWGVKDGKRQGFILDTGVCNLPADVNGDGIVNDQDLLRVLFEFGNRCGQ